MTTPLAVDGAAADPIATSVTDGVRMGRLRAGSPDETLFLFAGLRGDPTELVALVSALVGPQEVYAVTPLLEDAEQRPVVSMERMAELVVTAIRRVQPSGPYRLGGYSFGGLLALELAQQLIAKGEAVEAVFLIDAVYDERYWARRLWLRAMARRTGWQLRRIAQMPPTKAFGELRLRGVRLIRHLRRRGADAPDALLGTTHDEDSLVARANAAMDGYRPRYYDGAITLIASSTDRHFGCDTAELWKGYAAHLVVQRIDGDHLTVMHEPALATAAAGVIDRGLALTRESWTGLKPTPGFERPLILTTMRWFSAARLAHSLIEAGFSVSACRPRGHALEMVDGLIADCRLNRLWRLRSLVAAIRQTQPDIILPDDERALVLLRRLYSRIRRTDPQIAALIARSLGPAEDWSSITSRTALANEARAMNIAAPVTTVVSTAEELGSWTEEQGLPTVLKTDGSWGGRGVAIVREATELRAVWRTISSPPSLPRAVKRALFDLEVGPLVAWVRRVRPVVNAQQFVDGREAMVTIACLDGKVHALGCFEVVTASEPKGPAAIVRIIDHPGMADAARRLVGRFGLSGFCGLDFILTEKNDAQLLEMNPRVTPTCHLLVEGNHVHPRTITLFPAAPVCADDSGAALPASLDVPERAPRLIHRGQVLAARDRRPVTRMKRQLKQRLIPARY